MSKPIRRAVKTAIFVLSLFFVVWCYISVKWYVCGIKHLCDTLETTAVLPNDAPAVQMLDTPTEVSREPLQFAWSDDQLKAGEELAQVKDSLQELFATGWPKKLAITGSYYQNEENNSDYENLGLARAQAIATWLKQEGFEGPFEIKADLKGFVQSEQQPQSGVAFMVVEDAVPEQATKATKTQPEPVQQQAGGPKAINPTPKATDAGSPKVAGNRLVLGSGTLNDPKALDVKLKDLAAKVASGSSNLLITGHADPSGDALADKKAGLQLATEVAKLLAAKGVDENKILTESAGSEQPWKSGGNKRVEIIIQ